MRMLDRPVIWFDTETTSLDPTTGELLEMAYVNTGPLGGGVEREFASGCIKVKPTHIETAESGALRINGYTPEKWINAMPLWSAMIWLKTAIPHGAILAGHNVRFDYAFVKASCERIGREPPDVHYHFIDTCSLALPMLLRGRAHSLSLDHLCTKLGISNEGKHSALADVRRSIALYRALITQEAA